MCNKAGLLIAADSAKKRFLVTRANCDTWSCTECKKRMSQRWSMRASAGVRIMIKDSEKVDFVTLTSHEKLKTFSQCYFVWSKAWNKLHARLNYAHKDEHRSQYLLIPERHKDGRMHVHALWNFDVSASWLRKSARKCGLGYQCDVKPLIDGLQAAKYTAKYLSKDLGDDVPKRFRRVRTSLSWFDFDAPKNEESVLSWTYVTTNQQMNDIYRVATLMSYDMYDVGNACVFDDVDLDALEIYNGEREEKRLWEQMK